ncbi:MAG TPA: hypothetical protein VGE29_05045 [Prosthecobacter sp.]
MSGACECLPDRVSEHELEKHARPGEPVIVVMARGIGSIQPYEFRDRDGRSYLMSWDAVLHGHVLKFPWHLWMDRGGQLAHAVMNRRRLAFPLITLVEWVPGTEEGLEPDVQTDPSTVKAESNDDVLRYNAIVDVLAGGAMRLRPLAKHMGVTEAELRSAVVQPDCPVELNAAGWVRVKP